MTDLNDTLKERGSRYGELIDNGKVSQAIKTILRASIRWESLAPDQKEALDNIAGKIGRALTGDPDYADNWHDIAGYATLVVKRLQGDNVLP